MTPLWRLARWVYVSWAKRELTRTNPTHPDLAPLVIAERELRA